MPDGCRPMSSPRYGVMWSAAVPCLCWEGENSPKAGGLQESLKSELSTDYARIAAYDVGFGQCIVSPDIDTKGLDQNQWGWVIESWLKTAAPWQWEGSVEEANHMFPMVSNVGNSCAGPVSADAPFCRGNRPGKPDCAVSQKAAHLDALDNPRHLTTYLSCCVCLRNLCRRLETPCPYRGIDDS